MAFGDKSGRAKTDPNSPRAFAVCDYCGEWHNRLDLIDQAEWYGDVLQDTGYRACYRCISQPQPQLKPVILPEDPVPIVDPRVEVYSIPADSAINPALAATLVANMNNGFKQAVGPQGTVITLPPPTELDPTNPFQTKALVLASSRTGWGLPQPTLTDRGTTIQTSGVGQQIMAANAARQYLLVYSPFAGLLAVAQNGPPTLGIPASYWANPYAAAPTPAETGTVIVGIGQGVLQSSLTTVPGTVWQGSVWALGLIARQPLFAWEG